MATDYPDWTALSAALVQQNAYTGGASRATSLASNATEEVTFLAPSGTFVNVAALEFQAFAPSSATTGTHSLEVVVNGASGFTEDVILGGSKYTDDLTYKTGYWYSATSAQNPPSTQPQCYYAGTLGIDDANGLTFMYTNNTDVSQTIARSYGLYGIQSTYKVI